MFTNSINDWEKLTRECKGIRVKSFSHQLGKSQYEELKRACKAVQEHLPEDLQNKTEIINTIGGEIGIFIPNEATIEQIGDIYYNLKPSKDPKEERKLELLPAADLPKSQMVLTITNRGDL